MVLTYRSRELCDTKSGWLVVAYTEFSAKAAAFLLFKVYDCYRLCCLSSEVIRNIRCIEIVQGLGVA